MTRFHLFLKKKYTILTHQCTHIHDVNLLIYFVVKILYILMYSEKSIPNLHWPPSILGVVYIHQPREGSWRGKTGPCGLANRARMDKSLSTLESALPRRLVDVFIRENGEDCFLFSYIRTKEKLMDGNMESFHVTTYLFYVAKYVFFFKAIDKIHSRQKRDINRFL